MPPHALNAPHISVVSHCTLLHIFTPTKSVSPTSFADTIMFGHRLSTEEDCAFERWSSSNEKDIQFPIFLEGKLDYLGRNFHSPLYLLLLTQQYAPYHTEKVRILLEHGADVYLEESEGSPFICGVRFCSVEVISLLIQYGDTTMRTHHDIVLDNILSRRYDDKEKLSVFLFLQEQGFYNINQPKIFSRRLNRLSSKDEVFQYLLKRELLDFSSWSENDDTLRFFTDRTDPNYELNIRFHQLPKIHGVDIEILEKLLVSYVKPLKIFVADMEYFPNDLRLQVFSTLVTCLLNPKCELTYLSLISCFPEEEDEIVSQLLEKLAIGTSHCKVTRLLIYDSRKDTKKINLLRLGSSFQTILSNCKLERLCLQRLQLDDEEIVQLISILDDNETLQELVLDNNCFTSVGLSIITNFLNKQKGQSLRRLSILENSKIENFGKVLFLQNFTKSKGYCLDDLELSCDLEDNTIRDVLTEAIECSKLRRLHLDPGFVVGHAVDYKFLKKPIQKSIITSFKLTHQFFSWIRVLESDWFKKIFLLCCFASHSPIVASPKCYVKMLSIDLIRLIANSCHPFNRLGYW